MTEKAKQIKHHPLIITLLEDLHTGTGTGNITVDAVQTRNEQGLPVIDRHHFRGVLKDNALRLKHLGVIEETQITNLFGKKGCQQRKLDCTSLIVNKKDKDRLIYWDSTARQRGSRCPEDNSLRRIEYIRAGTKLTGEIVLTDVDQDDIDAYHAIIKFTTRLGAERTRGSGQIQIEDVGDGGQTGKPKKQQNTTLPMGVNTLRILLKNKEPLCIPTSGHAGNIIHTESHIPGRTLFAALCSKAYQAGGNDALKQLFTEELQIGNAYPIPEKYKDQNLQHIQCFPMPNYIHSLKASANNKPLTQDEMRWPHWARSRNEIKPAPKLSEGDGKDINLFGSTKPQTDEKTNRPKGAIYLFKDQDDNWRRYCQPLTIRMRNQRGIPIPDKDNEGKTIKIKRKHTELFSEQRIPANTYFLLEIQCASTHTSLLRTLSGYLGSYNQLTIGRSKAPVSICGQQPYNKPASQSSKGELILTATSDWIIRGDNLGYLTGLNKTMLSKAFFGMSPIDETVKLKSYQETETQGSFNYATKLPKRPFEVIKRGSSFKLSGNDSKIQTLFENLTTTPVGERITEGYGQFEVNLPITLATEKETTNDINENIEENVKEPTQEGIENDNQVSLDEDIQIALKEACKGYWVKFEEEIISPTPSREEWNQLKQTLYGSHESVYQSIVSGYPTDTIKKYFFTDQKGNNLGRKLDLLTQTNTFNNFPKTEVVSYFLSEFETYLYGEEVQ